MWQSAGSVASQQADCSCTHSYPSLTICAGTFLTEDWFLFQACTGGGCTLSAAANATTLESAPDMVQDPVVTAISSSQLMVTWAPPLLPNGEWTKPYAAGKLRTTASLPLRTTLAASYFV